MLSRLSVYPLSVVCQLFSNRKGSLIFYPIFPIFSLSVHKNIVEVDFDFLLHTFPLIFNDQK